VKATRMIKRHAKISSVGSSSRPQAFTLYKDQPDFGAALVRNGAKPRDRGTILPPGERLCLLGRGFNTPAITTFRTAQNLELQASAAEAPTPITPSDTDTRRRSFSPRPHDLGGKASSLLKRSFVSLWLIS
jgi:hypothetical protein